MRSRLGSFVAVALGLVVAGNSCREESTIATFAEEEDFVDFMAVETCSDGFDCECPDLRWDSRSECLEEQRIRRRDEAMVATDNGLTYDGECVVELIQRARALECEVVVGDEAKSEQREAAECLAPCKAYFGDKAEGEACRRLGITVPVDDCGQGLRCEELERVCVPLCDDTEPLAAGDQCLAGIEELGRCEAGTFCEEASQTCIVAPALGEVCEMQCAPGAWCNRTPDPPVCVETLGEGTACVLPEACISGVCEDQVCTAPAALVCPT